MPSSKIKNIILDLGNTLVYFDYCYFYDGVARLEKRVNARGLKKYFTEHKFDLRLGANRIDLKEAFRLLKKKFDLKIGYNDFRYLYCDIFWENNQMKNFLENKLLDSDYKLYMLSNVDSSHINFIDHNFPYVRYIKRRILSYKVKAIKPDKKIYRHLIQKTGVNPSESIFVDDKKENILSARKLGFNAIHYTSHKRFLREFNKLMKS